MKILRLNVGCGIDYRDGFINIDGSTTLSKIDKIISLPKETLESYFGRNCVDYILSIDFIEHHFHWEAVKILNDFYSVLKSDGLLKIRAPDCEYIIKTQKLSIEEKLVWLYGGQDIGQRGNIEMNKSRKEFPQFFCHKFGWTQLRIQKELEEIGFREIVTRGKGANFEVVCKKK